MDDKHIDSVAAHVETVDNIDSKGEGKGEQYEVQHVAVVPKRSWRSAIWDTFDKSPEERRLVFKLDCALLGLGCLGQYRYTAKPKMC